MLATTESDTLPSLSEEEKFRQICNWALRHPVDDNNVPINNEQEKLWGNTMINQINNGQWTTKLGEQFVCDIYNKKGENPRRPQQRGNGHYRPDFETDTHIIEVKTRNWTTPGTAGEKVYGTPLKYAEIPDLYNKPLLIVCVAYQEHEFTHGNTPIFGDLVRPKTREFLDFYRSNNITFVRCSDLINSL